MKFDFSKIKFTKSQIAYFLLIKLVKYAVIYFFFGSFFSCTYNPQLAVVKEDYTLYLPKNSTYADLKDSLKPILKNEKTFDFYAKTLGLEKSVKPGKYIIKKGSGSLELIKKLVKGEQDQQKLVIKNHRTIFELAGAVSKQIEADSTSILQAILEFDFPDVKDNKQENAKFFFLPETYFVWWNVEPKDFVQKMVDFNQKFWTEERLEKAKKIGLSPKEVYILASLVQLEASVSLDEQRKVAKAYLNRLEKGMRLESDPTAVYGYSLDKGFEKIYRVYKTHIQYNSRYNTYKNSGLPPSAICLPNASAIDAVLDPDSHNFVFFSAKPDGSRTHFFTNNIREHQNNANAYRNWLNKNNIK